MYNPFRQVQIRIARPVGGKPTVTVRTLDRVTGGFRSSSQPIGDADINSIVLEALKDHEKSYKELAVSQAREEEAMSHPQAVE
jgi:hypothetical protein